MATWTHLAHLEAEDGKRYFASIDAGTDAAKLPGQSVTGFSLFADFLDGKGGHAVTIKHLLAPVPYDGDIVCIGLNYRKHAEEANLTVPLDPVMWYKPRRALGRPGPVAIPKVATTNFLDFEGELVVVTSKDALDVSIDDAPGYILGYTVGNDLTARGYQDPKRGGQQFTRCKAFDGFAPLGPVLANAQSFGDVASKRIVTRVNGKIFQDSDCDLIHDAAAIVSFLSQGATLPAGSMIMTGSPPGIGYFSDPQYSLKDRDVVSVEISGIGTLMNTMIF
ncbi:2-hydroxyhepta-2,4-diene-1,7-dioate isomerase [Pestalotiopsis sp. NC0098]|nr:2-hydroxyhepta-2,4-diene-1,7-dioate isomerase [Pestalotiopsis sp. NC0098]